MKKVKKLFTALSLLVASKDATSIALPATVNFPVRSKPSENNVFDKLKTAPYHFTKSVGADLDTGSNLANFRNTNANDRLKRMAVLIKDYAKANNYSLEYCFLVDMSIPSGKNRFFVYNMRKDSLEFAALVAHGFGSTQKDCGDQLVFSNNNYSFKTSLGKYKIGKPYKGQYGLSYKLYGLDSTNNKAFERAIVLHSDQHVPDKETFPGKIFQSAGCPTVSPSFLPILGSFIKSSQKPILMWIYS
ncbi:MAG: murein L,D-transpeptidase catalytic domain-containing protein [Ferruginibacter sp.]